MHRISSSRNRIAFILPGVAALLAVTGIASSVSAQSGGTYFRDLVGVNAPNGIAGDGPLGQAIGNARADLFWQRVEPTEGDFRASRVRKWGDDNVDRNQPKNITSLPIYSYGTVWAADYSSTSFEFNGTAYEVTNTGPREARFNGGRINNLLLDTSTAKVKLPIHPDHVQDWADYVQRSTSILVNEYSVEHFQIWNEPNPESGFYFGDMDLSPTESDPQGDGFFDRIHKPASDAIRAAGGKVVFGGWPLSEAVPVYTDWLDYHDGWGSIDVAAMHYRPVHNMEFVRKKAAAAGYPDLAIWQTEMGNTANDNYLPNFYPRFAQWALMHNDGDPNRYRAYYYPYAGADDDRLLVSFNELTQKGKAMRTMGELLGGGPMEIYEPVSNDRGIGFNPNGRGDPGHDSSSMETFRINDRLVVAMHLHDVAESDDETMTFTFEMLDPEDVEFADRVTPWGERIDVMDTLEDLGENGISFEVPTSDIDLPEGGHSTSSNFYPRTFFVELGIVPEPTSAALLGLGTTALLGLRRRRRAHA